LDEKELVSCWRRIAGFGVSNGKRFCCYLLIPEIRQEKGLGIEIEKFGFRFCCVVGCVCSGIFS